MTTVTLFSILTLVGLFLGPGPVFATAATTTSTETSQQFIQAGFALIRRLDCANVTSMSRGECTKMRLAPVAGFRAHVAVETGGRELVVSHPEGKEEAVAASAAAPGKDYAEKLKALIVLDPLADRAFGHPVFIFRVVSLDVSRRDLIEHCSRKGGLVYEAICIYQVVKRDCSRAFKTRRSTEAAAAAQPDASVNSACEFQFLPHVSIANSTENILHCFPHAQPCPSPQRRNQRRRRLHRRRVLPREFLDWARGPQWLTSQHPREVQGLAFLSQGRPARSTSVPTDLDTQTFSSVPPPNHRPPLRVAVGDAECSNYNRCDHALLLAPGTTPRRGQLIDKLGSLGFSQPYLSVFPPEENRPGSSAVPRRFRTGIQGSHPHASLKNSFRAKLQKLCHTPRCVSSLFLYLNNVVLPNGDMLLGTHHTNLTTGRYTTQEFLEDISGCQATLVFAVVDQNFGGVIVEGLRAHPADFTNLVLLSATRQSSVTMALHSDASSVTDLAGQPMADLFYGKQGDFRLLHFEIYGVEGLLTYALENLPLSRLRIGEVQKQIQQYFPTLELGSFYGSRVQTHTGSIFSKPILTNHHKSGFLQGHLASQSLSATTNDASPTHHIAGCISLSPIDWLRNYLPSRSTDQI